MPKSFTVDNCLCFRLETGGLIIAWWQFIQFIVGSIACVVFIIIGAICDNAKKVSKCDGFKVKHEGKTFCMIRNEVQEIKEEEEGEEPNCTAVVVVCSILLVLCLAGGFISWLCIKGIQTRNHSYVKPMMILLGILAALTIPSIIVLSVATLGTIVVNGYFFLVMYSLYIKFQSEHERGANSVQYGNV